MPFTLGHARSLPDAEPLAQRVYAGVQVLSRSGTDHVFGCRHRRGDNRADQQRHLLALHAPEIIARGGIARLWIGPLHSLLIQPFVLCPLQSVRLRERRIGRVQVGLIDRLPQVCDAAADAYPRRRLLRLWDAALLSQQRLFGVTRARAPTGRRSPEGRSFASGSTAASS